MRIALAQISSSVGDFVGNRQKIVAAARTAQEEGADIVLFPELTLFGYPALDLLDRESVVDAQLKEFQKLQREIPAGLAMIVGLITRNKKKPGRPFRNTAAVLIKGKKPRFFFKELLPTYDVFDEARYVEPGEIADGYFTHKGKRILMTVCEDIWGWDLPKYPTLHSRNPLAKLKRGSCDLVLNMSASPFMHSKAEFRRAIVKATARHFNAPVVYVNTVGAQDELIFDGGSFVMDKKGDVRAQCLFFEEDLNVFDLDAGRGDVRAKLASGAERTRQALVLGIRDFVKKIGIERVHLGLSGGIDSAVVTCLAVDALGADKVTGITLPSRFNAEKSKTLSDELGKNLGIRVLNLPIDEAYETVNRTLQKGLGAFEFSIVNENMQSRLRGLFLMAFSNKENSMLLTTGNKSEYATGYTTLYGDMCGGLAPLGDLVKNEVYELAKLYNAKTETIPAEIITRAPSAELRPNQTDQDSLPPYDELDSAVRRLVEDQKPARTALEKWLLGAINRTEFKRWQAPPILKVSKRAFGRGRRYPLCNRSKD